MVGLIIKVYDIIRVYYMTFCACAARLKLGIAWFVSFARDICDGFF